MDQERQGFDQYGTVGDALAQADSLAVRTRDAARWLARYYVVFGVASALMAVAVGVWQGGIGTLVVMLIWAALIVGLSIYCGRQQTMVRGGGRLHRTVIIAWTALWALTVAVGSSNNLPWPWWLAGGLAMLTASLIGAWVVLRRTLPVAGGAPRGHR